MNKEVSFMYHLTTLLHLIQDLARSCLGQDLTFFQMKTIVTAILWHYHVQVVKGYPISPRRSVMLHMKHGLKVRVSKRSGV